MTIRAKLYAAIVLTILGPLATTAVALHGMSQMGDRFDQAQQRAQDETIARELKFAVTDVNGWQTAYGYDNGASRPIFVRSATKLREDLALAADELTEPHEQALLNRLEGEFKEFMRLDAIAYRELRNGNAERVRQLFLGPEIENFQAMAKTSEILAAYEARRAEAADGDFTQAKDDARKRLIAVALGAGIVIILLLVTAQDVVRLALEGEKVVGRRRPDEDEDKDDDDRS
ncbi:MAG: hypothetical protein EXQ70_03445 [Solirubrobacterales bacterium]|nr:hypothetical protein [Solirubrobacterales bacterium]